MSMQPWRLVEQTMAWSDADACCWQILGDFRKTTDEGERLLLAPV
jgi:hypothetical protein